MLRHPRLRSNEVNEESVWSAVRLGASVSLSGYRDQTTRAGYEETNLNEVTAGPANGR